MKSAIYIRAQIYIYTLSGGERVDDGDDEREEEEDRSERFFFVSRDKRRHVWSEGASAEKTDWGERCVGFGRE